MRSALVPPVLFLLLALLAGCAGPRTVVSEVTRFADWPMDEAGAPARTVRVRAGPDTDPGSLEFQVLARYLANALDDTGLQPSGVQPVETLGLETGEPVDEAPDLIASLDYDLSGPEIETHRIPGYTRVVPRLIHTARGPFLTHDFIRVRDQTFTVVLYSRHVAVRIDDGVTGRRVFEADARSRGPESSIAAVFPQMVRSLLRDFPGDAAVMFVDEVPLQGDGAPPPLVQRIQPGSSSASEDAGEEAGEDARY